MDKRTRNAVPGNITTGLTGTSKRPKAAISKQTIRSATAKPAALDSNTLCEPADPLSSSSYKLGSSAQDKVKAATKGATSTVLSATAARANLRPDMPSGAFTDRDFAIATRQGNVKGVSCALMQQHSALPK
jgi:hypothetical protein